MQIVLKLGAAILFLMSSFYTHAQDIELIKIQSIYYPSQTIEESSLAREIGFWEWSGQLTIPQPLKNKKTVFLHQLKYNSLRVEMEGNFPNGSTEVSKDYHTVSYGLSWIQTLNPKWQLMVNLIPTIASDLTESLSGNDFFFLANAIAIRTKSDKLKYGLGLAYTTSLGQQLVIPTGMLKYNTEKLTIDALLPNKLSVMLKTKKVFQYGFQTRLDGGFFNNSSEVQIVNDAIDGSGYSRLNIGPMIVLKLKEAIKINFEGGMAVARRLDFIDSEGDSFDRTPDNGPFFRVGLSLSPKGKNGAGFKKMIE